MPGMGVLYLISRKLKRSLEAPFQYGSEGLVSLEGIALGYPLSF